MVTKDNRQCGHLIESSQKDVTRTTNLTIVVERDQVIDIDNSFWIMPTLFPIVLNFAVLLIFGMLCVIMQCIYTKCEEYNESLANSRGGRIERPKDSTEEIRMLRKEPENVTLNDFNENFDKSMPTIRSIRKLRKEQKDVPLSDFYENFGKSMSTIRSTDFGKMIIVIAIFFSIPVFELTSYNLVVSNKTIELK